MNQTQEILDGFLSEAGDWGEKFVALAFEIADNNASPDLVGEMFRGVHSLKGGASFIAQDEPRLCNLCEFCHDFETFLDGVRKGKTELNEANRDLVSKALYGLHDDIVRLQNGDKIDRHEEMLASFKGQPQGTISVDKHDNTIIFSVNKDILHPNDVGDFNKILWKSVRGCSLDTKVVFDLGGVSRLSSTAVGSIVGTLGSVSQIAIVRPPAYMNLVFKRFRFEEFGIQLRNSLEECR
jgi:anti-anti-sigma regulatory factor